VRVNLEFDLAQKSKTGTADSQHVARYVRFGSKADVTLLNFDVRFIPEGGHSPVAM
jgi:hypothetical protein